MALPTLASHARGRQSEKRRVAWCSDDRPKPWTVASTLLSATMPQTPAIWTWWIFLSRMACLPLRLLRSLFTSRLWISVNRRYLPAPADMGPSHCIGRIALFFACPTGAKISTYRWNGIRRPLPTLDYRYQGLFLTDILSTPTQSLLPAAIVTMFHLLHLPRPRAYTIMIIAQAAWTLNIIGEQTLES